LNLDLFESTSGIVPSAVAGNCTAKKYSKQSLKWYLKKCEESGMIAGHTRALDGAFVNAKGLICCVNKNNNYVFFEIMVVPQ